MRAPVRRASVLAAVAAAFVIGAVIPLALAQPTSRLADCGQIRAERDGFRERSRRATRATQRVRRGMATDQRRLDEARRGLDEARRQLDAEYARIKYLEQAFTSAIEPLP